MKRAVRLVTLGCLVAACGGSTDPGGPGADAGTTYDDCAEPSECVIRSASCCGQCGAATRDDVVAVNGARASAYAGSVCGDAFGCPACYMEQDPRLVATCDAGRCRVVDLATHDLTACAETSDCRVRTTSCCECGGELDRAHLVALPWTSEQAFSELRCGRGSACPECAPVYPPAAVPRCVSGHCDVLWQP